MNLRPTNIYYVLEMNYLECRVLSVERRHCVNSTTERNLEQEFREHLQPFISRNGDPRFEEKALKALRFLMASGEELTGELAGWAGGLVYFVANRDR